MTAGRLVLLAVTIAGGALLVAGCGSDCDSGECQGSGSSGTASTTGSTSGSSSSGSGSTTAGSSSGTSGFVPAPHDLEQVPLQPGGAVFDSPTLVTVTYADDPARAQLEAFGAFLVSSSWLSAIGPEYGITAASQVNAELPFAAPAGIDDAELQTDILGWISDGGLPSGDGGPSDQYIYMVHFPDPDALTVEGQTLCTFSAGGYHSENLADGGRNFAYAVVGACPEPGLDGDAAWQIAASHEFIEASTDPTPVSKPAYSISDLSDPWYLVGGEVGDLCSFTPPVLENGYVLTQVWSNQASLAGGAPCVPDNGAPFIDVDAWPAIQNITAGESVTVDLTGWSGTAVAAWNLYAGVYFGSFTPEVALDNPVIDNGGTATVTITAPTNAVRNDYAIIFIGSYNDDQTNTGMQVVAVVVR